MRKTAVVICPGRGTYNAPELGYLARHHSDQSALLDQFDERRAALGQPRLRDLDGAQRFSRHVHTRGDNASALIYAASYLDALKIGSGFDVLAVTGNSMGWYSALAVAGAAFAPDAFEIVNTMGTLMQESLIGGQSLYPFVDDDWRVLPGKRDDLLQRVATINAQEGHALSVSIHLGGMLVVAGDDAGLNAFEQDLPKLQDRFPMRLPNHAAFHSPLQTTVAAKGQQLLPESLFHSLSHPLIDGRGALWFPDACAVDELRAYTLGAQVVTPYDFTTAVQVAAKTFAPDVFILTGPGEAMGSAVAQSLIQIGWKGVESKRDFQHRQARDPILLSMGRDAERVLVVNGMS
jgi:[acyl-carrier-protein] S-malonyltransferase